MTPLRQWVLVLLSQGRNPYSLKEREDSAAPGERVTTRRAVSAAENWLTMQKYTEEGKVTERGFAFLKSKEAPIVRITEPTFGDPMRLMLKGLVEKFGLPEVLRGLSDVVSK